MKNKKIFGIGASVLMILLAFIPAVNSEELNKKTSSLNDEELEIISCLYKEVSYNWYEPNTPAYVLYDLEFNIKVNQDYSGPIELKIDIDDTGWKGAYSTENYEFVAGRIYPMKETIVVKADEENDFAMRFFTLTAKLGGKQLIKKSGTVFTKFWKSNWQATDIQKRICQVWDTDYWDIDYVNLKNYHELLPDTRVPYFDYKFTGKDYYYNLENEHYNWENGAVLPNLFVSDQMGYVKEFIDHITDISVALIQLGIVAADWLMDIYDVLNGLEVSLDDLSDKYDSLKNYDFENPGIDLIKLIAEFILSACGVGDWILDIIDLLRPGEGKEALRQLKEEIDEMLIWWNDDPRPYERPIKINGNIYNVHKSNTIVVAECRDKTDQSCSGDTHHRYIDEFEVSSEKIDGDKIIFRKCVLYLKEKNGELRTIYSPECLSWAIAGGSITFTARFKDVKPGGKSKVLPLFDNIELFQLFRQLIQRYMPIFSIYKIN